MKGLYKFGFFRYFKSLFYSPRQKTVNWTAFIAFYVLLMVGVFNSTSSLSMFGAGISFVTAITYLAAAIIGINCNQTPNPSSLIPIKSRLKLTYRYLSSLLLALIYLLAVIVAIILVSLLIILITAIFEGGIPADGEDTGALATMPTGVYGGIFAAAFFVICFSAGMLTGFIGKRKYNVIFTVSFIAAVIISFFLMGIPFANGVGINLGMYTVSPYAEACYQYMAAPWLCSLIWCLLAAAMFGASLYFGLKATDPKKY